MCHLDQEALILIKINASMHGDISMAMGIIVVVVVVEHFSRCLVALL